jgi:arylsulfatase A-like enzyme
MSPDTHTRSDTAAQPNVLLIVLDTVSARHTSLHGHGRETTPGLDRLAAESTVYEGARASSNWSLPSHASLFTGAPAHAHRLTMSERLRPEATVFESLAADGYDTGVFSENPWLTDHPAGFGDAFGTVVSADDGADGARDDYRHGDHPGVGPDGYWFAERLLAWIDARSGPWAACLTLMDAHFPYNVRPDHDAFGGPVAWAVHDALPRRWEWDVYAGDLSPGIPALLEALYESGVRQADAVVEGVWSELRARGVDDDTLVVVTSDHGECFAAPPPQETEPPALEHGLGTHEDLYHVPLLVKAPGQTTGRRVDALAGLERFPAAVAAARDGAAVDTGWFVAPGGTLTAHQPPLHERLRQRARRRCADPDRFDGAATVVYDDAAGDAVEKRAVYRDGAYAATVRGTARDHARTPASPTDVAAAAAAVTDATAAAGLTAPRENAAGDASLLDRERADAGAVEARLEDLGYL